MTVAPDPAPSPVPTHAHRERDEDGVRQRLEALWKAEPGLYGWLGTVDHKRIGKPRA